MTFDWDGDHLAADLGAGARALFSTRRGGVSSGPFTALNLGRSDPDEEIDDRAAVAENRARLARATGAAAGTHLRMARQVHGVALSTDAAPLDDADGQVTATAGVRVAVVAADCLPVAVAGPGGVAMLHAGWRGLAGGILGAGVRAVSGTAAAGGGTAPGGARAAAAGGPLVAAIGPAIGVCCYEVGDEVRDAFAAHPSARRGRHIDLKQIARRQLLDAGVARVEDCELCTHCEQALFFSHRRDGAATGRQGGVAWRS